MAFSLKERQLLGIHGLLPPAFMTQNNQAKRVMENIRRQANDLARYVQINALQVLFDAGVRTIRNFCEFFVFNLGS